MVKLSGVQFQSKCLIVEEARSRSKSSVQFDPHSRPHVINNSWENESTFSRNNFVPGDVAYADTAKSVIRSLIGHTQNCTDIFGDRISRKIPVCDFNRELDTGHAKIITFPRAISREFPHCVTPTLEDGNFDIAILHFGVNDLLQNRNELILTWKKTATKCMLFGVRKVIVLGIVFNKRVANSFVDEANSKIISMSKHNSFE